MESLKIHLQMRKNFLEDKILYSNWLTVQVSLYSSLKNGLKHPFKMSDLLLHAHKFGICLMIIFLNFITQFLPCLVMHLNSIFMQQKIEQIDKKCCCYFTAAHWEFYTSDFGNLKWINLSLKSAICWKLTSDLKAVLF